MITWFLLMTLIAIHELYTARKQPGFRWRKHFGDKWTAYEWYTHATHTPGAKPSRQLLLRNREATP